MSLSFPLVYHEGYDLCLGDHVFPSKKYRLIREHMLAQGFAEESDFLQPEPASDGDLLLVHDRAWISKLKHGTLSYFELMKLEIPYSQQMIDGFWLAAGGTLAAARAALERRFAYNVGGGFHHAYPAHGEGFCAIHDVAVAIRRLQSEGAVRKAMVIDVDVHHGNGTAAIFRGDPDVFTLSIHQFNNYPGDKPPSTVDIHLEDGVGDEDYLDRLTAAARKALDEFRPGLLMYVAGADPYREDQLGGLMLTIDGLYQRDLAVLRLAAERGIPVASTLAGGYAVKVEDTVTIHTNTARAMAEVAKSSSAAGG